MAYPPELPPATRTDDTLSAVNHAQDHNRAAAALRTIVEELGAAPAGAYASLTERLLGIAAGQDAEAISTFLEESAAAYAARTGAEEARDTAALIALGDADATLATAVADRDSLVGPAIGRRIDAVRLHYANVYDGFFAGKNRAQDTSVPTIWANDNHLTDAGLRAWADYIVAMKNPDGSYVIAGDTPKVVWIGDSWIDQGDGLGGSSPILADAVHARIPGATVVVKGIGGQTSTQVLARFDADVPADADYVIFNEPGVNDATINGGPTNGLGLDGQLANLATWVRKIRALGAVPVWTGHVPLGDWPRSRVYHQQLTAIVGDGTSFPTATPASTWSANVRRPIDVDGLQTSIGYGPALSASGIGLDAGARYSTAAGIGALDALGLGSANTAFGYKALNQVANGIDSTAVGSHSFTALTGANGQNSGLGANTGRAVTTGTLNTFVGLDAGYRNDALSTTNATTTGSQNVFLGAWTQAKLGSTSQATIIGARGKAGQYSTAIGYKADASLDGSVAIGCDGGGNPAVAAAANFIALGTTNHTVHVVGNLRVEKRQNTVGAAGSAAPLPATPSLYFILRASDGSDYAVPAYAKV